MDLRDLSKEEIGELSLPYQSYDDIRASLSWDRMDEDWKTRLSDNGNGWWLREGDCEAPDEARLEGMIELRDTLLEIGGESVCLPRIEEDLGRILQRGILWSGENPLMMLGEPSHCHSNAAYCWDANRDKITIATGYALSADGMWRQHSWCIGLDDADSGPYVIETTAERVAYFGFPMTYDECDWFYYENS